MSIVDWVRGLQNAEARANHPPGEYLWLRYYEQLDVTAFGDDWPVYSVARWERNEIGETRFTGEARIYRAVEPKGSA